MTLRLGEMATNIILRYSESVLINSKDNNQQTKSNKQWREKEPYQEENKRFSKNSPSSLFCFLTAADDKLRIIGYLLLFYDFVISLRYHIAQHESILHAHLSVIT